MSDTPLRHRDRPTGLTADEQLLAHVAPPGERPDALRKTDPWRVLRITAEFVEGFEKLGDVQDAIAIFGSARTLPEDPHYQLAVETARLLAEAGYPIITGGGPGIMEAANRGAVEGEGTSIGCNIELPQEQGTNPYVRRSMFFRFFFVRKTMFVKYSMGFVVFPGGYGTLDELFEALTLIQTGKVLHFPIVLVGRAYWGKMVDWLQESLLASGKIDASDLQLFHVTDDPHEVLRIIEDARANGTRNVGLSPGTEGADR